MSTTSVAGLVEGYPEFAPMYSEDAPFVTAVLARAERRVGGAWPSDIRDDIVYLTAAHMLALSPMGRNAQMSDGKTASSVYSVELAERKRAFALGRSRVV